MRNPPPTHKPLFFCVGNRFFAVEHILSIHQHEDKIDVDYGREETLTLQGEEAKQFLALLQEHCQVITAPPESGKP